MQRAPVVSLALGPCAGLGAGRVAASHFSVMVKGLSLRFSSQGRRWRKAIGEDVDKEGLGGWEINGRNGVVDNVVNSEHEAFAQARRFLSYMPAQCRARRRRSPRATDDPNRRRGLPDRHRAEGRQDAVHAAQDYRRLSCDRTPEDGQTSFFEIGALWGRQVVTGLARIDGHPVAIIAGDPFFLDGAWTADACDKVVRHIDLADTFHLPVDPPCRLPGLCGGRQARAGGRDAEAACARWRRSIRRRRRSCLWSSARRMGWQAAQCSIRRRRGGVTAGRQATGARCRWRVASRRLTNGSWKPRPIRKRS